MFDHHYVLGYYAFMSGYVKDWIYLSETDVTVTYQIFFVKSPVKNSLFYATGSFA